MSASVDQRGKGQPSQGQTLVPLRWSRVITDVYEKGPWSARTNALKGQSKKSHFLNNGAVKDTVKDEEFETYLQPPHQGYGAAPMSSPVSDPFMPNYYNPSMSFPYLGQGLGDGAWSNGSDTSMFSVGGYEYNGMFSGFGYPQFWGEYQPSEYWGNTAQAAGQGRKDARGYEEYYRTDGMIPADPYSMNGELDRDPGMNSVEQGLKGMNLSMDKKVDNQVVSDVGHQVAMDPVSVTGNVQNVGSSQGPKKTSWAAIASQPARPQPPKLRPIPRPPLNPNKQNLDIGTWDSKNNVGNRQGSGQQPRNWSAPRRAMTSYSDRGSASNNGNSMPANSYGNAGLTEVGSPPSPSAGKEPQETIQVLEKLQSVNQYNPKDFNLNPKGARFFIIKSYSEDDIHRSIKYSIWCSTEHGNKRLDAAYREREGKGPVYLLYSVNGSGHFCGMAQMMTGVDYSSTPGVWAQDKWKGQFEVKWIYVKDVPNSQLRHIRLENNENKPVTNSRDTQEVPPEKGKQVLKIIHNYRHTTSIFDDFGHYEKRQEEDLTKQGSGRVQDQRP